MLPLARAAMMLAIAALPFAGVAATKRHAHPAQRAAPPPAASAASANASDVPVIAAPAWLVLDTLSGQTLAAQNADALRDPASLTKLMTAYVVFDALRAKKIAPAQMVNVSTKAWKAEGSRMFVEPKTPVSVDDLVHGMIVQSGNDASIALAELVAGSEDAMVARMNQEAARMGLAHTRFTNVTGLTEPQHASTAADLAKLTATLIRDFPEYYPWYSLQEYTWNNITQHNRNGLLTRDPTVDGLKTGHTDTAGYCLVTSANHNGMRLISVVLGSPSIKAREDASAALLGYGYTFYETARARGRGEPVVSPRVYFSASSTAPLGVARDIFVTVPRGDAAGLRASTHVNEPLRAPLVPGQPVGELTLTTANGDLVARAPLVPLKPVPVAGLWTRMSDHVALWFR